MRHSIWTCLCAAAAMWLAACQSGARWNNLEFYSVERQEQLSDVPLSKPATGIADGEKEEEMAPREMDVRVDMEFLTTRIDSCQGACRLINSLLTELLLRQPSDSLTTEEAVAQYIEDVKAEFRDDEVMEVYYDHLTGRAEYGLENVINYRLREEVFTGGAHPCTVTTILRFNATTGEFIALDNIFPVTKHSRLKELLLARLMARQGVQTMEALRKQGFLEMTEMFVSPNFALREDSIEFHYNEYDIAPYAYGACTLCLSYEEAQEVMAIQTVKP